MNRFDFLLRWAPKDPEGFRRFFAELVELLQAERATARTMLNEQPMRMQEPPAHELEEQGG